MALTQGSATLTNSQWVQEWPVKAVDSRCVMAFGSFEGNGASAPTVAQTRGNWFVVTRVSTGRYRVTFSGFVPNLNYAVQSPAQTVGAGNPPGLLGEPDTYICSETVGTAPAQFWQAYASKFDSTTNPNSFDIFTFVAGVAVDVSSADRVNFNFTFKDTAFVP
jgi:hypothetical protein